MRANVLFVFRKADITPKSTYKNNDFLQIFKIKFSSAFFRENQFYFIQNDAHVNILNILLYINMLICFDNSFKALRIENSQKIRHSPAYTLTKNRRFMLQVRENTRQ